MRSRWGIALVLADRGGRYPTADEATADFTYVFMAARAVRERLYRARNRRVGSPCRGFCDAGRDVYVYCNNDVGG